MLRVENVSKVYPTGTQALKDVSFQVADGEFLVVIGLSGSGKSTLLRCINRLIDPTEGKIFWDDTDITAASQTELRRIRRNFGMVFQQFNLVKRSSVITNVLSGRLGYANPWLSLLGIWPDEDRKRALHALERVGIADKAHNRADHALRRPTAACGNRPGTHARTQIDTGGRTGSQPRSGTIPLYSSYLEQAEQGGNYRYLFSGTFWILFIATQLAWLH